MKLSIIVPCHNEEKNLPLVVIAFAAAIHRSDIEVIIVNNCSNDNSATVLAELASRHPFLRIVNEDRPGYGFAILSGLRAARGTYIGWTHGDLQTPASDVIRALDSIEAGGNSEIVFVKGRRRGRPLFDVFFTMGMSFFESIYFRKMLVDINAQPTIFHRSFFARWADPPTDFALDLYAFCLARASGLSMVRFDVFFKKRLYGESNWNKDFGSKIKFIKRTIRFSRALKKRLAKLQS